MKLLFIYLVLVLAITFYIWTNVSFNPFSSNRESLINLKKWTLPNSIYPLWYKVIKNGYNIKLSDTGIKVPTTQYSITFICKLTVLNSDWGNIFHVSNTGKDCCGDGDRNPALWFIPRSTNLYLRFSTDSNANDGFESINGLILNTETLVSLTFDNNTVTIYFNNTKMMSKTFNNIHTIKPTAILYMGDPWYSNTGTNNIQDFTIYDGVLTSDQIASIYQDSTPQGRQATAAAKAAAEAKAIADAKALASAIAESEAAHTLQLKKQSELDAQATLLTKAQSDLHKNSNVDTNTLKTDQVSAGITKIDRYADPMCKPNEYIYCLDGQIECNDILGGKMNLLQGMDPYVSGNTLARCGSYINKTNISDYTKDIDFNKGTGVYFDISNCSKDKPWKV